MLDALATDDIHAARNLEGRVPGSDWKVGLLAAMAALGVGPAFAQEFGPQPGGIDLQPAATPVQAQIIEFHQLVMVLITAITLLVLALLIWVVLRYRRGANPTPKTFSHNTTVEIIWTVAPVLVLVLIAFYSFPLLAAQERTPKADVYLKVTGVSWAWNYSYPDYGVEIASYPLSAEAAREAGKPFRQAVDTPLVVPVGATVAATVTSADVIHSWGIPSFGFKQDAIPGRLNEGWFKVEQEGVYYGFCYELCGLNHSFMPVEIHAVSPQRFAAWISEQGGDASAYVSPAARTAALALVEE